MFEIPGGRRAAHQDEQRRLVVAGECPVDTPPTIDDSEPAWGAAREMVHEEPVIAVIGANDPGRRRVTGDEGAAALQDNRWRVVRLDPAPTFVNQPLDIFGHAARHLAETSRPNSRSDSVRVTLPPTLAVVVRTTRGRAAELIPAP